MKECLQLLIKKLRHLQHELDSKLRSERFIHSKLINVCQNVSACQYACYRSSDSLSDFINDLKSSIVIYQKTNSNLNETFFIDRRYHKNFFTRNFQSRINQNRRFKNRSKKKCFVCQKESCWFIKHSKIDRDETRRKFSSRFSSRIRQYISKYEETNSSSFSYSEDDSDTDLTNEMKALIVDLSSCSFSSLLLSSDKFSNVKTFLFFENSEIMINNLINRFLIHSLIFSQMTSFPIDMKTEFDQNIIFLQISLKNDHFLNLIHISMKNIDLFI